MISMQLRKSGMKQHKKTLLYSFNEELISSSKGDLETGNEKTLFAEPGGIGRNPEGWTEKNGILI